MGNGMFAIDGIDLPQLIETHVGSRVLEAVLTIYQIGERDPANLSAGQSSTPVTPAPKCRGLWKDYRSRDIDGEKIKLTDRKAVLFPGNRMAEVVANLKTDDEITMEGVTLAIVRKEKRDPAAAAYVFQCRDRKGPNGQ